MKKLQLKRRLKNLIKTCIGTFRYKSYLRAKLQRAEDIAASDFVLPYIEMRITTRCNMKCRKCGHFIPCYKSAARDLSFDDFKIQFDNLINAVSYIKVFSLVGGEAMLSEYIYEILEYTMASDKIGEIRVVSNGKKIPPEEFMKFISNTRVCLHFSVYPQNIDNYPKIKALCKKYNVSTVFYGSDSKKQRWYDYGEIRRYGKSSRQLTAMSEECFFGIARQYCNGILFLCPRISNAYELGLIDIPEPELYRITDDVNKSRRNIINFYSMPYSYGCKYCNANKALEIDAAEQIE